MDEEERPFWEDDPCQPLSFHDEDQRHQLFPDALFEVAADSLVLAVIALVDVLVVFVALFAPSAICAAPGIADSLVLADIALVNVLVVIVALFAPSAMGAAVVAAAALALRIGGKDRRSWIEPGTADSLVLAVAGLVDVLVVFVALFAPSAMGAAVVVAAQEKPDTADSLVLEVAVLVDVLAVFVALFAPSAMGAGVVVAALEKMRLRSHSDFKPPGAAAAGVFAMVPRDRAAVATMGSSRWQS